MTVFWVCPYPNHMFLQWITLLDTIGVAICIPRVDWLVTLFCMDPRSCYGGNSGYRKAQPPTYLRPFVDIMSLPHFSKEKEAYTSHNDIRCHRFDEYVSVQNGVAPKILSVVWSVFLALLNWHGHVKNDRFLIIQRH